MGVWPAPHAGPPKAWPHPAPRRARSPGLIPGPAPGLCRPRPPLPQLRLTPNVAGALAYLVGLHHRRFSSWCSTPSRPTGLFAFMLSSRSSSTWPGSPSGSYGRWSWLTLGAFRMGCFSYPDADQPADRARRILPLDLHDVFRLPGQDGPIADHRTAGGEPGRDCTSHDRPAAVGFLIEAEKDTRAPTVPFLRMRTREKIAQEVVSSQLV